MDPTQWIASFKALHDQARRNALNPFEKQKYLGMRDELARSLMAAQKQDVPAGVLPRRALSVAQLYSIEVNNVHRVMTRELSCLHFVTMSPAGFQNGELVPFVLTLGRSIEPVKGDSVVKSCLKQGANTYRLTCEFKGLTDNALERIEDAVFDAAIARLK